ncbi:Glycosyltransferase AglE [uncultured archaeon]|nr:Glycosyltransferase AglE [uncultured archaeon]
MKKEFITILIPCFNSEKTLENCLKSILNQNYKNYEVVLVDNNSNDSTKNIIKEFQKKSPKLKYVFEPKRGRGAARNAGVKIAKAKIIAMIDSDCIAPKNWLLEITKLIRENKEKVIQGGELDAIGNYWSKNIQKANEQFISKNFNSDKRYVNHLDTKNFAIRSSLLKYLMFDESLGNMEDFELGLRLRKKVKIRFLNNIKVKHYHKSSLRKFFALQFDRAYWTYIIFQKHKYDSEIKKELMFGGLSLWNNLSFPPWIIKQFLSDLGVGFFLFISKLAWTSGTFYAIARKFLNNLLFRG